MKIGYARVSTTDQDLKIQIEQLKEAGCEKIYTEKESGARSDRPQLEKCLNDIRKNDVLIICKLDRLARSTSHLLHIVEFLKDQGATFLSLGEPWADTTTHAGKMIMTVFAGIAEFEKDLIRDRTGTGRIAAKKRGVKFGRPGKISGEQKKAVQELLKGGQPVSEVARMFNVNRSTLYRME